MTNWRGAAKVIFAALRKKTGAIWASASAQPVGLARLLARVRNGAAVEAGRDIARHGKSRLDYLAALGHLPIGAVERLCREFLNGTVERRRLGPVTAPVDARR